MVEAGAREASPQAPAAAGFRWPAEWEPHEATWLSWPHNADTWPGCLDAAVEAFVAMVRALAPRERVRVNVGDERLEASARSALGAGGIDPDAIGFHRIATDDAWVRDHGPIFVVREANGEGDAAGEVALVDFGFDAWGGKYPPWARDDAVPRRIAAALGLRRFAADFVLEGGSVDGNGLGTLLTTESCLLHPNRGPGRTRETMEARLADHLGARHVVWLGEGIAGDDTDGHIDDLSRFVDAGSIVTVAPDAGDAHDAPVLAENLARLRAARDAGGKPFAIATLPAAPVVEGPHGRCPASYANFYVANGAVLVPVFGAASDERALAVLRELFADRDVIGIPSRALVAGLGAVHCLTQQQPALPGRPGAAHRG